jgi:hypothetical protein
MPITRKDSILKQYYEANGQQSMFGYDNLEFKTINHPTPHRFVELCTEFKLKQLVTAAAAEFSYTETSSAALIGVVESQNAEHLAHFEITL